MKDQLLNIDGLAELVQEIKEYISEEKVLSFSSTSGFPSIGKPDTVYIDTTRNMIYRWDDENVKYYPLAFDPGGSYILNCGSSADSL